MPGNENAWIRGWRVERSQPYRVSSAHVWVGAEVMSSIKRRGAWPSEVYASTGRSRDLNAHGGLERGD